MPQQLACPKCRMVVSAPEAVTAAPALCPSCQAEMTPVEEDTSEPIVAEVDEPAAMRMMLVEVGAVPHSEPPKWKPTAVAEAWRTVAQGLNLQRWALVVAILQPIGILVLDLLDSFGIVQLIEAGGLSKSANVVLLVLIVGVGSVAGVLLIFGRLCCYRVPPKTGARLWMGVAGAGTAIATPSALVTSVTFLFATDTHFIGVLHAGELVTLGLWLAAEWSFLYGLSRIGHFVKRRELAFFSGVTAVAATLVPLLGMALVLGGARRMFFVFEVALAGLCVMYLLLLRAACNAVQEKAPKT